MNFPADTTGVIDNNNGHGIQITWAVGAGASFQSGTLATAWAGNTSANDFVGQVNGLDSTSNNFHLTGVQLEVGEFSSTTLPPFQHESFADNLARCQRYFQKIQATVVFANHTGGALALGATNIHPMRANPTASTSGTITLNDNGVENFNQSSSDISLADGNNEAIEFSLGNFSGMTNRRVMRLREGGGDITLSSEL